MFDVVRSFNRFIKENSEDVGKNFAELARSMHYGQEEERSIYGVSTPKEVSELVDEGIGVVPVFDVDKIENG